MAIYERVGSWVYTSDDTTSRRMFTRWYGLVLAERGLEAGPGVRPGSGCSTSMAPMRDISVCARPFCPLTPCRSSRAPLCGLCPLPPGDKPRRQDLVLAPDADGRQRNIRKLDEQLVERSKVRGPGTSSSSTKM